MGLGCTPHFQELAVLFEHIRSRINAKNKTRVGSPRNEGFFLEQEKLRIEIIFAVWWTLIYFPPVSIHPGFP